MDRTGNNQKGQNQRHRRKEGAKILPFRRELSLNLGVIIFLFILLYLAVSLIRSVSREPYSTYAVGREESLGAAQSYRALILRQEEVIHTRWAGYVDRFAPESGHVGVGSVVTSVDEIGTYSKEIKEVSELNRLSKDELRSLKSRLQKLSLNYDGASFSSVYESSSAIRAFFSTHIGRASLDVLEENAALNEFFHLYKSDTGGMILYYEDGFENKKAEEIRTTDFDRQDYQRKTTEGLVTMGDFLYKLVSSEDWTLLVPIQAEEAARYGALSSLTITFLKNGLKTSAACKVINGADGTLLLQLDLSHYLIQFATDRFTEIRIEGEGQKGYKIPLSCRVEESVYLIPREFEVLTPEGNPDGFVQEIISGNDTITRAIRPVVYRRDETYCYVNRSELPAESVLLRQDSQERHTVRLTTSMTGVYQVNAGYTVFCPVEILEESGEYLLVKRGTPRGIQPFDELLLNGKRYSDGQILR
ncbi:MAG: hypothetical protein J6H18_01690 [Lachnospiraceae bacterium]|nr:hypothetical protein [Lachnospiraceae bacterium]